MFPFHLATQGAGVSLPVTIASIWAPAPYCQALVADCLPGLLIHVYPLDIYGGSSPAKGPDSDTRVPAADTKYWPLVTTSEPQVLLLQPQGLMGLYPIGVNKEHTG